MPTVKKYREYVREYKKKNCPPYSNKKKEALKKIAIFLNYKGPTTPNVTVKVYKDYIRAYKKKNCLPFSKLEKSKLRELAISYGYKATDGKTKKVTKREPRKRKPEVKRQTKPPKPKPEVKKPEPKPSAEKKTLDSALSSIVEKARALIKYWDRKKVYPAFRRSVLNPMKRDENRFNKEQSIIRYYKVWEKRKIKFKREIESQLKPLRDSYDEIYRKNEGLNLRHYEFPTFVKEFRKLDTYIESVMHPAKFAAPKPKQQMKIQQTKPEVTPEVKTESEPITRRGRLEKIFGHYTADQELDADRDIAKTLAKQEYKNKTLLERSHPDIVIKKLASHAYKFGVFDTEGRVARDFTKFQQYMKRYPDFKSLTMMRIPEKKAVSILIQYVDPKNEYSGIKIRKYIYKGQGDYKFIPGTPKHMQDF